MTNKEINSNQQQPYYEDDEITLKELILKIQEFGREVWKHWKLVVLITFLFVVGFIVSAWLTPITYQSKLTFMLNDDEGGGGGGAAAALLGQFGFGGRSVKGLNISKMIELSKSRRIVSMVLFEKITVDGLEDFIANHLIKEYKYQEKWEDNEDLKGFLFRNSNLETFNIIENSILKSLHGLFVNEKEGLINVGFDEESNILTLKVTTTNEELSLLCSEVFFYKLEEYYVEKAINKQQATYDRLLKRTDSLGFALNRNQLDLLKFEDNNRNLGLRQYGIERLKLQGEVQKLISNYEETYKQLMIAEYNLQDKTPFITTVDEPIYPIIPTIASKIKAILIGGFLGVFLVVTFIVGRKVYRDMME